jgi:membrane-bound ClpP family serine protease
MLEIVAVVALLVVGILLIILELVFVPGTTIVGVAGLAMTGIGLYLCYSVFGSVAGNSASGATLVISVLAIWYSLKTKSWQRFALFDTNTSRMNDQAQTKLQVGDIGVTLSTLRPSGNAEFNDQVFEVRTLGHMISQGTKVKVVQVDGQRIIVEPIS